MCLLGDFNARTGVLLDRMETTNTKYEDENAMMPVVPQVKVEE